MHCHSVACTAFILSFTRAPLLGWARPRFFCSCLRHKKISLWQRFSLWPFSPLTAACWSGSSSPRCRIPGTNTVLPESGRRRYGTLRNRYLSSRSPDGKRKGTVSLLSRPALIHLLVDSLLRFWMVDEMVIYLIPRLQGGIRLFGDALAPSVWKLTGNRHFDTGVCRLDYLHTGY